jgi:hypothetical protein
MQERFMAAAEKPDLRELVGVSVNASSLVARAGETHLDRVGAMGAASCLVSLGADRSGVPIAAAATEVYRRSVDMRELMLDPGDLDARDRIAGELAPLLWRLRYGGQHELLAPAIRLYARWLATRRSFAQYASPQHAGFLERFATAVLHEYLSDICQPCGGSGKLERTRSGTWIRPRGSMQRNATFGQCRACSGSGRARPSHGGRARWLQITLATYEDEHWAQRFTAALNWLTQFHARRLHRPLTQQLERYKKPD